MESIQAVGFNTAINITSLGYSSTTQRPLINIAVSSVLATNHGHPLLAPGQEGRAAEGAQRARTGTAPDRERGNTDWNPTPWCHPGICFIAAL